MVLICSLGHQPQQARPRFLILAKFNGPKKKFKCPLSLVLKRCVVYEIRRLHNDYISVVRWQSTSASSSFSLSLSSATHFRRQISNIIDHNRRPCAPGRTPAHGRWFRRAIRNTRLFRVSVSQSGPKPAQCTEAVQLCVGTEPNRVLMRHSDTCSSFKVL